MIDDNKELRGSMQLSYKDEILTDTERKIITGMSIYWREVAEREDNKRILYDELISISRQLGAAKVLSIISRYVELTGLEPYPR